MITKNYLRIVSAACLFAIAAGCNGISSSEDGTFALYRNSITDMKMRIHVATFDSIDGAAYNSGNCEQAQELFQSQPMVKTKFWCEKGKFHK